MTNDPSKEERSLGEIAEAWCQGKITSTQAIAAGDFDGFAELLDFAIRSDLPLRTQLSTSEGKQAELFTSLMTRP